MAFGKKVKAYPLDESGPKVGFVLSEAGPHDEGKDEVQVGNDKLRLAYRDPKDYDAGGPNGTYCDC